jgi:hypothetical protein
VSSYLLLVNTAQKANLVKVDHNGLGGLTISPTPDGTKFVFGNNIELHIPLGTDKVLSIVKNEPIAGKMAEYRVLMGTYIIIFGTDYQKFLQTYKEVTNNTQAVLVNPDGKFQMLIKLDPFTSTWTFSVMDTALLNQDFSTHAVNDKLAQIRMGFEN